MTNTVFIVVDTAGNQVAAIQPNTLDGPSPPGQTAVQQNSDLSMFGLSYPLWGQSSDQNDYRLCENFACPPLSTFPSSARYLLYSSMAGSIPAGAAFDELGPGNGINVPLVGQLWYNTLTSTMYVCISNNPPIATWSSVATETTAGLSPPASPSIGQLWYNTALPQLEVWTGAAWVSVAARYLPLSGGTMTGAINMGGFGISNGGIISAAAINSTAYQAPNSNNTNQITVPSSGNTTISDGPRIGNYIILHTGNYTSLSLYAPNMIIMWYGSPLSLPSGWHICDGGTYNGHTTPNLIGLIPFAANPGLGNVGAATLNITTGGSNATISGTVNGTSLTISELAAHSHDTVFYTEGNQSAGPPGTPANGAYWFSGGGNGTAQTVTTGTTGTSATHTHTLSVSQTPHTHSVGISAFGLYFIMYTG